MKVWNLVYVKSEDGYEPTVKVETFSTEAKAEDALSQDYEKMLEDYADAPNALDIVRKENYGNNAKIQLGYDATEDWQEPEVEVTHSWRVSMQTVHDA